MDATDAVELRPTAMVPGGDALAREESGRVVFVSGALPGERVLAALVEEKRDFAPAVVIEVVEPSTDRVTPPCPAAREGCGGCGWQHVALDAQRRLKADVVRDALRRVGHVEPPAIHLGPDLAAAAFRTNVRCAVRDGRPGFRRLRSHDLVMVDGCPVAHPLVDDVLRRSSFGTATEITVRAGAATGERLVIVHPSRGDGFDVPDGVAVVGDDELRKGRRVAIHERVAGRTWQISARSFFQARPDGAEALVVLARDALDGVLAPGEVLADLYAGVGLFGGAIATATGARLVAVERHPPAVRDARRNLADLGAQVVHADVAKWRPVAAGAVVADPARTGLGRRSADAVAGTGARCVVLVSCDPAALGRDAALLTARGFSLDAVTTVDLFPHTPHVETVAVFRRS